ncbi:hypothetical protein [Rodentibacter rarus]|nr:hypothetical protein [Rodentibacter rarus]
MASSFYNGDIIPKNRLWAFVRKTQIRYHCAACGGEATQMTRHFTYF